MALVVVGPAWWAVPLLLLMLQGGVALVALPGCREAALDRVAGGAGAAREGEAVLERCKPL